MKDWFKALFGYTAGNILSVLSFVFAAAVFYTVFWLYGVETEPVLYATLISAVILLIVFVLRFSSVYKKHKRLEKIKNDAEYAVLKLPDYEDPIKKDLADIAEKMSALKTDAETRIQRFGGLFYSLGASDKNSHSRYEAAVANKRLSGKRRA